MKAINLVNSSTVNSREGSDFYPTPPDVTHALMKFLKLPSENYTIWEPACGDGSMSKVLSEYCENVIFFGRCFRVIPFIDITTFINIVLSLRYKIFFF